MATKWIRNLSLGVLTAFTGVAGSGSSSADDYYYHNGPNQSYVPSSYPYYSFRPTLPYYGNNFGVNGYSTYSGGYNGYGRSSYGGGAFPRGGSYGGGAFPRGGSYGGGAFPRGGSYGGGAFPRRGSYGGRGNFYIGR